MRVIRDAFLAATLAMLGACAMAPTEDVMTGFVDDPQALERVWLGTRVVFPEAPKHFFARPESGLDRAVAELQPRNLPAVIYLNDCEPLHMASNEMLRTVSSLAEAGFAVFVPNSLDRPRAAFCNDANTYEATPEAVRLRLSELLHVRERIQGLSWVDPQNVFAVGSGLGGVAVTKSVSASFPAVAAVGVNCHPTGLLPGIAASDSVAVLVLLGSRDTTFRENPLNRNCAARSEMRRSNRNAILLDGAGHDVTDDPKAIPQIAEFLKSHTSRPIQTVNK